MRINDTYSLHNGDKIILIGRICPLPSKSLAGIGVEGGSKKMTQKQVRFIEKLTLNDDEESHLSNNALLNLKVVYFEDGRRILVKPDGMVDVALRELDAKVVEVNVEKTDEVVSSFEKN